MKNKVLVLLSTYNGEKYLKLQLDSIISQKSVDVYLLCRDDGSKDNTLTILSQYAESFDNISVIKGENVGCARSYYYLLEEAYKVKEEYDYFAFSDQDDVWLEDKLNRAVDYLEHESKYKQSPHLYCSNLSLVDANLKFIKPMNTDNVQISKAGLLVENICTGCTMVFNKCVVELFNRYKPESFRLHDIWIAHMCVFFGKIYYDDKSYILYRQHGRNVVGAKYSLKMRIKSKWKSLKSLSKQHFREDDAKNVLKTYDDVLTQEDKCLIQMVANLKAIDNRIRLLRNAKSLGFVMRSPVDNFWLKIRIILGVV